MWLCSSGQVKLCEQLSCIQCQCLLVSSFNYQCDTCHVPGDSTINTLSAIGHLCRLSSRSSVTREATVAAVAVAVATVVVKSTVKVTVTATVHIYADDDSATVLNGLMITLTTFSLPPHLTLLSLYFFSSQPARLPVSSTHVERKFSFLLFRYNNCAQNKCKAHANQSSLSQVTATSH